ncbi:PREDICTED: uncharacterized protein At4g02000-like [Nicotiana attenuata]|uniref:uncharacterized protein At4g02000-like n=1 Tax=Nicotiana attenuata TaxID=49451 RepID=UPI0009050C01|nr:PREDICTED: uncharacterized protein At4g02000-like [Nicotiana attenuata]
MPHYLLRSKLVDLWSPSEQLILIDLGWDFFIVKFSKEENLVKALQKGPWFLSGNFLSVRRWEPKFVPQEATLSFTAIWVRLPQLPTEFYDKEILVKVGRKLGKLLKIDTCTSATLRGRYARICIQVPLEKPVATSVTIGDHKQLVLYEGENVLCTGCGRIGHTLKGCTHRQSQYQHQPGIAQNAQKIAKETLQIKQQVQRKKKNGKLSPSQEGKKRTPPQNKGKNRIPTPKTIHQQNRTKSM